LATTYASFIEKDYSVPDSRDHTHHVNTWMRQAAAGLSSDQLLELFEQGMRALWNQAYLTLGEITLTAIVDRVLYDAAERFPPFESLKVEPTGIDCRELRNKRDVLNDRDLADAIRFVVSEFLIVIGNLTAEILTPSLHAELSKVKLNDSERGSGREEGKS
jgi:hypothetical protein